MSNTDHTYGPSGSGPQEPTYGPFHTSGAPTSGAAYPAPTSGAAYPAPTSGGGLDQYGLDPAPGPVFGGYTGPRIEPTPKQPRGRFLLPALAGLLAGLVVFGAGGFLLGRSTAPEKAEQAVAVSTPTPSTGVYEQNQIAINTPKFTGALTPMAEAWLPHLSGCSRNGDRGGPSLNAGEKARVRCEMDTMSVIFVEYATVADRDKARVTTLGQNVDARTLTPGVGAAQEKATPSGRTEGNYVEYAYQVSGNTVAGIWWDDAGTPVAAYLLAYWKDGIGRKWDPIRDVWARYA